MRDMGHANVEKNKNRADLFLHLFLKSPCEGCELCPVSIDNIIYVSIDTIFFFLTHEFS